jgi:adenylate cyclase
MEITMGKRWRHWAICALIVAISVAAARRSDNVRFFHLIHLKTLDLHFVLRGSEQVPNIVLVFEDQKAIDTYTDPVTFWHPHYAEAIKAAGAGGAKVLGFDHAFGVKVDKYCPNCDQDLADAIASSPMPVVCAYAPELITNQTTDPVPVNMIIAALDQFGYPNITADDDGSYRHQEIMEAPDPKNPDAPVARSLALRVAEKYLGADAQYRGGRVTLAGKDVPTVRDRTIAINYAGPSNDDHSGVEPKRQKDTFQRVSMVALIDAWKKGDLAQLRKWVEGKVVMFGADSKGDRYDTPYFAIGELWTMPGVEIHANTVRTLIDRLYLREIPEWATLLAMLAAAAFSTWVIVSCETGHTAGLITAEVVLIAVVTHVMFRMGWILSTSEMLLVVGFCGITGGFYRFWRGGLFKEAIRRFVGQQVATTLETAEGIQLSGENIDVTILFTDIRGFTKFTEEASRDTARGPQYVVRVLNEYLAMMVDLIDENHGHVNKFIGDGILAVFSDKDAGAKPGDHARRAVRCANAMVTAACRDFKTGAGLHTGPAVVGNIGSQKKMEFTVLGDTVNLASRLESLNKEQHTCLIMSDTTRQGLGDEFDPFELGTVDVRGHDPVRIYTLRSLAPTTSAPEKTTVHA